MEFKILPIIFQSAVKNAELLLKIENSLLKFKNQKNSIKIIKFVYLYKLNQTFTKIKL